jgi:predicted nucleic acid-binding protein
MAIVDALPETPLVLDTNIFSHLRNKQSYVLQAVKTHFSATKQFPALTSITIFEALQGIEKEAAKNKITEDAANKYRQRINELAQTHQILAFDYKAAQIAAYVLPRLTQAERNKHWQDVFIVSTALAHNFGFVSQNKKDVQLIAQHLPENMFLRLAIWK